MTLILYLTKFYLGFGAGIISPNDVDSILLQEHMMELLFQPSGITGEFVFDNGFQLTGLLGYRFNDYLSFETELSYSNFDYDKVNLTVGGTATSGGVTFTGTMLARMI